MTAGERPEAIAKAYSKAISKSGKAAEWQHSLQLFQSCRATMASLSRTPDAVCFNSTISACGAGYKWQVSGLLLVDMERREVTPDIVSFSSVLTACERAMRWQSALALCEAVLCRSHAGRLQADLLFLTSAISACEKGQQWQWALSLLSRGLLSQIEMDAVCFDTVMSACERSLQWEWILSLFWQMRAVAVVADAMSYVASITAFSAAKKWQHCLHQLTRMDRSGLGVNVFALDAVLRSTGSEPESFRRSTLLVQGRLGKKRLQEPGFVGVAEFVLLASILCSLRPRMTDDWTIRMIERQAMEPASSLAAKTGQSGGRSTNGLSDFGHLACCDLLEQWWLTKKLQASS